MTKFFVASHGIIRDGDKILVTRRSKENDYMPGYWDFPGGKLEAGETPIVGLHREVKEETGLEVQVGATDYIFTNLEGLPESQYFLLVFECKYTGGDIILDPREHDDFKWVTMEELSEIKLIHFVEEWLKSKQ